MVTRRTSRTIRRPSGTITRTSSTTRLSRSGRGRGKIIRTKASSISPPVRSFRKPAPPIRIADARVVKSKTRVRNIPVNQLSSRPKPQPKSIRADVNPNARESFTFGIGIGTVGDDGNSNFFGIKQRFSNPKGTGEKFRKAGKQLQQFPIDVFNSRSGPFNNSPFIVGIRSSGRKTREQFDNILEGFA